MTPESRAWVAEVQRQLEPYKTALQELSRCERFIVSYTFIYPEHIFFTERGKLSGRTYDLSNTEKNLQDVVFKVIGTDDKYVVELHSYKKPGPTYAIEVEIRTPALESQSLPSVS